MFMAERYDFGNNYRIPDTIAGLVDNLMQRDYQRKRAIDIARARADAAETPEMRMFFAGIAAEMVDVRHEFDVQFPEIFGEQLGG